MEKKKKEKSYFFLLKGLVTFCDIFFDNFFHEKKPKCGPLCLPTPVETYNIIKNDVVEKKRCFTLAFPYFPTWVPIWVKCLRLRLEIPAADRGTISTRKRPITKKIWLGMSNAQNIYQKYFGDIGTKIDGKKSTILTPIYPYLGMSVCGKGGEII